MPLPNLKCHAQIVCVFSLIFLLVVAAAISGICAPACTDTQQVSLPAEATAFITTGQYEKASELLRIWLNKYPEDGHAWQLLARSRFALDDCAVAVPAFQKAADHVLSGCGLSHREHERELMFARAVCIERESRYDLAVPFYLELIDDYDFISRRSSRRLVDLYEAANQRPALLNMLDELDREQKRRWKGGDPLSRYATEQVRQLMEIRASQRSGEWDKIVESLTSGKQQSIQEEAALWLSKDVPNAILPLQRKFVMLGYKQSEDVKNALSALESSGSGGRSLIQKLNESANPEVRDMIDRHLKSYSPENAIHFRFAPIPAHLKLPAK